MFWVASERWRSYMTSSGMKTCKIVWSLRNGSRLASLHLPCTSSDAYLLIILRSVLDWKDIVSNALESPSLGLFNLVATRLETLLYQGELCSSNKTLFEIPMQLEFPFPAK